MGNITKQDIIADISKGTGLTQADVKLAVEEFLTVVSDTLIEGKNIEIRGFGTFLTKVRKPRPARNPKTGEIVPLLERIVPLFKFSTDLKKRINRPGSEKPQASQQGSAQSAGEAAIY